MFGASGGSVVNTVGIGDADWQARPLVIMGFDNHVIIQGSWLLFVRPTDFAGVGGGC